MSTRPPGRGGSGGTPGVLGQHLTITSDMFPKPMIGSVVGFGGFAGAVGGFLMNLGAGWFRVDQGNYTARFTIAEFAYLVATAAIHLLAPRLEPARLRGAC